MNILQVEEFQDFQVEDVVVFAVKYPDWEDYQISIINYVNQYLANIPKGLPLPVCDFYLLEDAYKSAIELNERKYKDGN